MTPDEPKIIIRDEALVAITSDGERPATPDEAFNWCIDQARKEAWAEAIDTVWGLFSMSREQYRRLHALNPYKEDKETRR